MKRLLCIFAALVCAVPLLMAQRVNAYAPVFLRVEKTEGVYQKGETVRVWADVSSDVDTQLLLMVSEDGNYPKEKELSLPEGTSMVFEQVYDRSVWVTVSVAPASNRNNASMVGFIVDPQDLTPGFDEPADFMSWWQGEIASMRAVPAEAIIKKEESTNPSFRVFSIEISMHEGNPVRGYVAMPADAAKGSLPVYFFAHGAGTPKALHTHASIERAVGFAEHGAIGVDINAHGMLNDASDEYYAHLDTTSLLLYQERPVRDRESYYFRLMFLRMVRALDYVCSLPEWDGSRVLLFGESQGGAQSFALAGLDSRVGAVVGIVPAITDLGGPLKNRQGAWPFNLRPMVPLSTHGREYLPYFDGAQFLKHFKGKLYIEAGLVDKTCPPCGVAAGYNTSGASYKEIHFWPHRGHTYWGSDSDWQEWKEKILNAREQFISDYLK